MSKEPNGGGTRRKLQIAKTRSLEIMRRNWTDVGVSFDRFRNCQTFLTRLSLFKTMWFRLVAKVSNMGKPKTDIRSSKLTVTMTRIYDLPSFTYNLIISDFEP